MAHESGQENTMIHFVGAGPGDPELITVKGARLLKEADVVIYAGSLVPTELLEYCSPVCEIYDSSKMDLQEVTEVMIKAEKEQKTTVRLHTGDPSIFGAIREQADVLADNGCDFDMTPGVSSFLAAAAAMKAEYTLPGVSQSIVITRMAGRTKVPDKESIRGFAKHGCTMVIFLSAGMLRELQGELIAGGYDGDTPCALAYKVSQPEEKILRMPLKHLADRGEEYGINKTALVLVGDFSGDRYEKSRLYDPEFSTGFRKGKEKNGGS